MPLYGLTSVVMCLIKASFSFALTTCCNCSWAVRDRVHTPQASYHQSSHFTNTQGRAIVNSDQIVVIAIVPQ